MIIVIIRRRVKKGEHIFRLLRHLRAEAMAQPGYVTGETLISTNDRSFLTVISTWRSLQDWKKWEKSQQRAKMDRQIQVLLAEEPLIETYEVMSTEEEEYLEDPRVYYDEAREKAMTDAKEKADKIAELAGVKLGMPTYINESASTPYLGGISYGMATPAPAPAPEIIIETPMPISPGEVEITVNMQVAYGITKNESSLYIPPASEGKVYIEGDNKTG